jgi:hypothetical protein
MIRVIRVPGNLRLTLGRLLAIHSLARQSWRPTAASRAAAMVVVVAAGCGVLVGVTARLMDVFGPTGIARVGAGVAAWITLAFWTARRSERSLIAVVAAAAFLLAWQSAYFTTDAIQQGVPVTTMWSLARVWVVLLGPASIFIGVAAWRSRRGGLAGDAALALPFSWSLVEAGRGAQIATSIGAWLLESSLLFGIASAVVVDGWRQRRVNARAFVLGVLIGAVGFSLAAAAWFLLRRP